MVSSSFDAELDEWRVLIDTAPFEPAKQEVRIVGRIYGDSRQRFADGTGVITSPLRTPLQHIVPGATVSTSYSRYRLLAERR